MRVQLQHWTTDPEYINLVNFLIEKTKEEKSMVLELRKLAREFKVKNKSPLSESGLRHRIDSFRPIVHEMEQIDMNTKVRLLFALSAPIDTDYLEKLKEQADITLDCYNRIIEYKTKGDGGLRLRGTHITRSELDENIRKNKRILTFLAQKSMEVDSPISGRAFLRQLKGTSGVTEQIRHLEHRFTLLKNKIYESVDFDQKTKIRMMFVSSANVSDGFLEIIRKNALVEVDENNRITKFKANDGSLDLAGEHRKSAKLKAGWEARRKKKKDEAQKSTEYDRDVKSENDNDDDFSEESQNDSDNDDYLNGTGESIDLGDLDYDISIRRRTPSEMSIEDEIDYNPSTRKFHRNEKSEKKEKRAFRTNNKNINPESDEEEAQDTEIVTTRSGRVSKQRVSDFNMFVDESNDDEKLFSKKSKTSSSAAPTSTTLESNKKKRKANTKGFSSSKRIKQVSDDYLRPDEPDDCGPSYSFHRTDENATEGKLGTIDGKENDQEIGEQNKNKGSAAPKSSKKKKKVDAEGFNTSRRVHPAGFMRNDELHDYNSIQSTDDSSRVELKPFRGSVLDNEHLNSIDDDIQVLERPPTPAPKDIEMIEAHVKTEDAGTLQQEVTPRKVESSVEEEVKPKFTSQLKLLETIKFLIDTLDISPLSQLKSKICLKIWKIGKFDKKIPNELMTAAMELLIVRIANYSVTSLSGTVESVGLVHFMCYLKAAIWSSKLDGLDSLLEKITRRSKDQASLNKSIPVEKVAIVLQATLDVIGF